MISVKLVDIEKRQITYDKNKEVFLNGENNEYVEITDRLKNNSVTAKMAASLMAQFVLGKGFGEDKDDVIINTDTNTTLFEFASYLATDYVDNRGVFIHVNYKIDPEGNLKPINPKVLPFGWCAIGKKDSHLYNGKIHVKPDWSNKDDAIIYDVYNPNEKVVTEQIQSSWKY